MVVDCVHINLIYVYNTDVLVDLFDDHLREKVENLLSVFQCFKQAILAVEGNSANLSDAVWHWLTLVEKIADLQPRFWASAKAKREFMAGFMKHLNWALKGGMYVCMISDLSTTITH